MGVCRVNKKGIGRRIDIRFFTLSQYYPAILYFTGSKEFNLMMRKKAIEKGLKLSEYGLFNSHGIRIDTDYNEKCIFDHLEIDPKYIDPTNRNM
jgi:DNA polymerase/3'-5' exonuclease PolX